MVEPDTMLSTSTLEDDDKKVCTHTSTATADNGDTKDRKKHNTDDDNDKEHDIDETGSTSNNKDNSTKDITSSSSSSSSVAMKRMSSTASLSEGSSSKRVKKEEPNTEEKARSPSALIEIVNDFARDHFDDQGNTYPLLYNGTGPISPILNENEYLRGYYDEQFVDESKTSDTEAKTDWEEVREQPQEVPSAASSENIDPSMPSTDYSLSSIQSRRKSYQQVEYERKEKRWERFLHILFSTDYALRPTRKRQTVTSKKSGTTETKQATSSAETDTKNFHPIHAWVRCLCSPYIGLEQAHSYGVWSVIHEMRQRIPEEFSVRDETDGNRTVFQSLAENKAADCKLSIEEKRDIIECIMEANYKAVHLPRQSDGRLIGHVAVENGWPVKDLLERKTSATCA